MVPRKFNYSNINIYGLTAGYFGKWQFLSVWEFFIDKRVILGKLLYVLIALILMLLSGFFIHNY